MSGRRSDCGRSARATRSTTWSTPRAICCRSSVMPPCSSSIRRAVSVTVDGAVRYGELCPRLDAAGFALHNLASLPHISVAGACATGTHGSGDRNGNLATAVSEIRDRDRGRRARHVSAADPDFPGTVVALGALGVVVRLTLDVEPAFQVRQVVYERMAEATFAERFDEITGAAHSVSLFTRWREPVFDQVWLKQRVRRRSGGSRRPTCSVHRPPRSTSTRSASSPPPPARPSWGSRARGTSACRTSGSITRRARAMSSRASTSCRASMRCVPSPR